MTCIHFTTCAAALAVATLTCSACGENKPPEARSPAGPSAETRPPVEHARSAAPQGASNVSISDEIRNKCGIPDQDAYFAFDSADVRPQDRTPLDLVATCFTHGPLQGQTVKLVGRADSRGESEYNMTLGQSRADAVGNYLVGHGMPKSKAESTSRGAMDATGSDESSWQRDRRVDVMLGN
jgi:peptidoglycan-associated lipoprotein